MPHTQGRIEYAHNIAEFTRILSQEYGQLVQESVPGVRIYVVCLGEETFAEGYQ